MKIKDDFVLQELVDEYIVVPVGEEADKLHGVIRLNNTGAFLWNHLSQKDQTIEDLAAAIMKEYSIDAADAKEDVVKFIEIIKELGCISE